jgi:uncharacterized protein
MTTPLSPNEPTKILNLKKAWSWPDRVSVFNGASDALLLPLCHIAATPLARMRGLLLRSADYARQGMLITPCRAIHSMWMGYAIDAVFLDQQGAISSIVAQVQPWRLMVADSAAYATLELACGQAAELELHGGMNLVFRKAVGPKAGFHG